MMMNAAVSVTRTPPITPPAIAPAFGALCLGEALEEPFVGALVGAVAELKKDPQITCTAAKQHANAYGKWLTHLMTQS